MKTKKRKYAGLIIVVGTDLSFLLYLQQLLTYGHVWPSKEILTVISIKDYPYTCACMVMRKQQ